MANVYRVPVVCGGAASFSSSTTVYFPFAQSGLNTGITTESQAATVIRTGGTVKNLRVYISTNGATARTLTLIKNGVATAVTLTVTSSTTGWFEDAVNSVTVNAGDTLSFELITNSANSLTIRSVGADLLADGATSIIAAHGSPTATWTADGYPGLCRASTAATAAETTAGVKIYSPCSATFKNLQVNVPTNTGSNNTPVTLRKNGVSGTVTTTVTTSASNFEDTSNSDSFSAGDSLNLFADETGVTNCAVSLVKIEHVGTTSAPCFSAASASTTNAGTTNYRACIGGASGNEAQSQFKLRGTGTIRNLYINVTGFTLSVNSVCTIRKNGAGTALTKTITGTGVASDTVNSFTYADGDLICFENVNAAGTGNITITGISFEIVPDAEAGATSSFIPQIIIMS